MLEVEAVDTGVKMDTNVEGLIKLFCSGVAQRFIVPVKVTDLYKMTPKCFESHPSHPLQCVCRVW